MENKFANISPKEEGLDHKNKKESKEWQQIFKHAFIRGATAALLIFPTIKAIQSQTLDADKTQKAGIELKVGRKQEKTTHIQIGDLKFANKVSEYLDSSSKDAIEGLTDKESSLLKQRLLEIEEIYSKPTTEQIEMEGQDHDIIGKTFEQQVSENGRITLDAKTREAIYNHHYKEYSPGGKNYKNGLVKGLERMRPWISEIRAIFKKHEIPEEFIYLAIAESHFEINAVSPAGAVGPYQITKNTARLPSFNLKVSDIYDERLDPIKSAELCAKHLKDSWERLGHNWSFVLMDYNGGITNDYIRHIQKQEQSADVEISEEHKVVQGDNLSKIAKEKNTSLILLKKANPNLFDKNGNAKKLHVGKIVHIPQERQPVTMDGFNKWLEKHINKVIADQLKEKTYTVTSGDTISKIAQIYDTTTDRIKKMNNMSDDVIYLGQKLEIPLDKSKQVHKILRTLSHFRENINYPEKFYAIRDVIEKEGLDKQISQTEQAYEEIRPPRQNITSFSHKVKKGENLTSIAHELKKKHPECRQSIPTLKKMFVHANKLDNENSIRENQELHLDLPLTRPATLKDVAEKYKVDVKKLHALNPAIKLANIPLSKNIIIRTPKG